MTHVVLKEGTARSLAWALVIREDRGSSRGFDTCCCSCCSCCFFRVFRLDSGIVQSESKREDMQQREGDDDEQMNTGSHHAICTLEARFLL